MHIETKCIQSGYEPKSGEPRVLPIYQSTTYKYDSSEDLGALFDLKLDGHMYTRISNPTVAAVEAKLSDLEGGVGALCTSSGQAANFIALTNIAKAGDNFVSLASIYGGTVNLFAVTMKKLGIEVRFVTPDMSDEEIEARFDDRTRALFGETIANPALTVLDIERFAGLAHRKGVPLMVDNTFATPVLCRPFEFGADIVIHSTTKYLDGHAQTVGGVIIDSGNFDWEKGGKYPELTTPDDSYHGVVYTRDFGKAAYITKARVQMMRDLGMTPAPMNAYIMNLGTETLALRMERHSENALKVAEFISKSDKIEAVYYPGLKGDKYYERAQKYLPRGTSGVIGISIKGGRTNAVKFMDALELASNEVHVADIRTCVLHPASATHRQLTDEQLAAAGIDGGLIRLSVGLENVDDIIADIEKGFAAID